MTLECYSRDWNGETILQMRPGSALLCKVKWPTVLVWSEANPTEAVYSLTGHFIRYTSLEPGWTHFCLQNCLNSSWHRFNKVLETFLRDFGPYLHDSITQLLQICRLHIHDANPPHPKDALLDWDLVTVKVIWVKWTHCYVQETSLRWFEFCDIILHYPAGSRHQKMCTLWS